ncbi:N-acetylmuramoyl-L-alanine amidase-like domain-containing protein [Arenibacter amylolyticus]|uniref:N-acetylmuramoyl-L-alanine amidase-like domain-containing protein n=1 Tax=Arenibacter amylolyticus TaxID=1406873 RepID=UPI000A3A760A|nr:N-acetylmuramoyl-L-alanine amidase-like domain-containing protein [Arenibacter amylolyticus]
MNLLGFKFFGPTSRILALLVLSVVTSVGNAQDIICSLQDRKAFEAKITEISNLNSTNLGETMVAVGKTFIGIPYVAKTLEIGDKESLVVNLQGLDCTTFVENVLAFSRMLAMNQSDFNSYTEHLETIRYRDGTLDGYPSRLHYFSEWFANNEKKGLIKDLTASMGGVESSKEINFMSTHRNLYPFLKEVENYKKIKESEQFLKDQSIFILPQDKIAEMEYLIQSGDIIAMTTSIEGLDITHTGIATREADGRIHLLHASTGSMEVEVTTLPLADYLKEVKNNTGIMVARVITPSLSFRRF